MALFIGIFLSSTSRVIVSLLKFDTVSHRGSTNSQTGRISRITIALSSCIGGSLKSLFAPLSVEVKTSVVHGFSMVFFSSPLLIRLLRKLCHVSGRVANACAIRRGRNLCWYALSLLLHCSKSLSLLQAVKHPCRHLVQIVSSSLATTDGSERILWSLSCFATSFPFTLFEADSFSLDAQIL